MLRIFAEKKVVCYAVYKAVSSNYETEISKLKQGAINSLLISDDEKTNAYFTAHFKLYDSYEAAVKGLSNHNNKPLESIVVLKMKGAQDEVIKLAAKGKFSEGIIDVINGADCVNRAVRMITKA